MLSTRKFPSETKLTFQADFVISKPLVFKRPEYIFVTSGQGNLFFSGLHHRPGSLDEQKLPLQRLLGILCVCRTGLTRAKTERCAQQQESHQAGVAQPRGHCPRPVR